MADLDPLGLDDRAASAPSELDPATYGFSEADLDREFYLGTWKMKGFLSEERPIRTLREVLALLVERRLHRVYVVDAALRPIGVITLTDILRRLADEP